MVFTSGSGPVPQAASRRKPDIPHPARLGYHADGMRILFVSSTRVGDAVLSTGLLDHLIRTYPASAITVVCGAPAEGVFARMPNRERTVVLHKRPYNLHWLPLWTWAAVRPWDLVVDIRGSALGWMVPTKRRAVMRRRPGHKLDQLAAVLDLRETPMPVAWTSREDEAVADRLLPKGRPIIALGPTAGSPDKIWPAERFAALARKLVAGPLPGAAMAVFGGPGALERQIAEPLLAALPDAIDLVGRLSLPEAAACLRRATIFVGNDSGLMHLASAAGTRVVGLFGPTPAYEYAPLGASAVAVKAEASEIISLKVEAAVNACAALLESSPHRSRSEAGFSKRLEKGTLAHRKGLR
jgi:ADP-heptose:LPS heptosyltransferase